MFQRRSSAKNNLSRNDFKQKKKDWCDIIHIQQQPTMLLLNLSTVLYNNCLISRALIGSFLSSIRVQTGKILILGVSVFYRVANLPIEKVCVNKNFEEANFSDFKRLIVTLKINPQKYNWLVNLSAISFQAQTGVLVWCELNRAKFMIRYESLKFACFWPDMGP